MNQRRIAFVFCPHLAESSRLDTMPFAAHVVRNLASAGWHIDLFLWSRLDSSDEVGFHCKTLHVKRVKAPRSKAKFVEMSLRFAAYIAYDCVFSVGLIGSYFGGVISIASRCPFVLLNDSFPSIYGQSRWAALQRWGARRADAIIVPSDGRDARLREELLLNADKPFITLRNTPELALPLPHVDWYRLLDIPAGKKIFIHAGSVADWTQVPEILGSVNYWPEDAVLLLHNSRTRDELARYRKELSHLDNPERVFWSFDLLSEDMLNSLTSSCAGSFALYRNSGPNIELIGAASGKLMRSIVCGTPVITSSFESLQFVTREDLGVQVRHPAEIPAAIDKLIGNRESYRQQCQRFALSEKQLREEAWKKVVECVRSAPNGVDLSRCEGDRGVEQRSKGRQL